MRLNVVLLSNTRELAAVLGITSCATTETLHDQATNKLSLRDPNLKLLMFRICVSFIVVWGSRSASVGSGMTFHAKVT